MSSHSHHTQHSASSSLHTDSLFADSHAHLDFPDFAADQEAVLQRAHAAGVNWITTISTRLTTVANLLAICDRYNNVAASVGIHPHYAAEEPESSVEAIVAAGNHPHIIAVGETGLDYHYLYSPAEQQEQVFRNHIQAAKILDLPLIIHTREAEADTRRIVESEGLPAKGGVLHCFTGSLEMAEWAIQQGLHISFSGVLTFKSGDALRQIAQQLPLDRLLIETDAPYLAPMPHRGKRNEPAMVVRIAETLAHLHGLPLQQVASITTQNYLRLFRPDELAKILSPAPAVMAPQPPTLAYAIGSGLYLNISKGCTLRCHFCPKWVAPVVHQYDLTLPRNPTAEEILQAMGDYSAYQEIVFCGYGEPTLRLPVLLQVAQAIKQQCAIPIRINTDGLANRVYRSDITPRLRGLIDAVSVSLNAQNEEIYNRHSRPTVPGAYQAVKDFLLAAKAHIPSVTATAIEGLEGVDIKACAEIAHQLGVHFRKRILNQVG
ncbi:TatD family hydrolase [Candidatus Magnetaquicoccus inordinatus]|uniref:TatD family hydrolase n=1 Tax=Candidatus Magnetaquicoccus inordinatus TaxID=2496818 RepID=UPI00102CDA1B|nr:TatD family hydrolase [Candidatus Magnetaquicoccus inordinatus]